MGPGCRAKGRFRYGLSGRDGGTTTRRAKSRNRRREGADALTTKAHGALGIPVGRSTRIPLTVGGLPLIKLRPTEDLPPSIWTGGEIKWQIRIWSNAGRRPLQFGCQKGIQIPPTGEGGLRRSEPWLQKRLLIITAMEPWACRRPDSHGARLHGYDKVSGKEVGAVSLPAPQSGSPMTYMLGGKQYIVVAVSGGTLTRESILRLPYRPNSVCSRSSALATIFACRKSAGRTHGVLQRKLRVRFGTACTRMNRQREGRPCTPISVLAATERILQEATRVSTAHRRTVPAPTGTPSA